MEAFEATETLEGYITEAGQKIGFSVEARQMIDGEQELLINGTDAEGNKYNMQIEEQ